MDLSGLVARPARREPRPASGSSAPCATTSSATTSTLPTSRRLFDRAATARRDRAAGRRRAAVLRGRAARPVRRGRRALPAPHRVLARRRAHRVAVRRSTCWPSCSGSTSTGPGCPTSFVERLEKALARYGVHGLDRTPELDAAVVWMFRSFARVIALVPVVTSILERRLRAGAVLVPLADADMREPAGPAGRGLPGTAPGGGRAGARRAVPLLRRAGARGAPRAGVRADRAGPRRARRRPGRRRPRGASLDAVVRCPQPHAGRPAATLAGNQRPAVPPGAPGGLRPTLLPHPRAARPALRRRRAATCCAPRTTTGTTGTSTSWSAYARIDELPDLFRAVATHVAGEDPQRDVVVDVATWRDGEQPDARGDRRRAATPCWTTSDFGRTPRRVDFTVTSTDGTSPEHLRTQHVTFRPRADGGFAEELVYRNLHPMLAKRLDLWRLANFRLERLPSAEDVYLFHGVAHDEPEGPSAVRAGRGARPHRRSPTPTGTPTYPWLERMGLQALAAMRQALAGFAPRERPVANRIVLYVRPPWRVPRRDLADAGRVPRCRWPTARGWRRWCSGCGSRSRTVRCATPCCTSRASAAGRDGARAAAR